MQEFSYIVDDNDEVVGSAPKDEVMDKHLIHRGVAVLILNSKREIFVHKRSANKNFYPGLYDIFCGGWVIFGESYLDAAKRELFEETGIKGVEFIFLFKDSYKKSNGDNVFAEVYKVVYDGKITIQNEEMEFGYFLPLAEMEKLLEKENFVPNSIQFYNRIKKENLI